MLRLMLDVVRHASGRRRGGKCCKESVFHCGIARKGRLTKDKVFLLFIATINSFEEVICLDFCKKTRTIMGLIAFHSTSLR